MVGLLSESLHLHHTRKTNIQTEPSLRGLCHGRPPPGPRSAAIGNTRSIFDERVRPIILRQSERTESNIVDREILEVAGDSLPARGISRRTEARRKKATHQPEAPALLD